MNIKIAVVAIVVGIMAMCLLATKPLANQAFAQLKPTELTIKETTTETTRDCLTEITPCPLYHFEGKLTSEGSGLGGKTIILENHRVSYFRPIAIATTVTDPDGTYSVSTTRFAEGPNWTSYSGDSTHAASKSPTIKVTAPPPGP